MNEWPCLSRGVTHTSPVNKQGLSGQEKSVSMIIMNYDISSQSCQFLFSLFYRQHQFVFNVWLIEASVPKQSLSAQWYPASPGSCRLRGVNLK